MIHLGLTGAWAVDAKVSAQKEKSTEFNTKGKGTLELFYREPPFQGAYGTLGISSMENKIQWTCYTDGNTKASVDRAGQKEPLDLDAIWKWTGKVKVAKVRHYEDYLFSQESKKEFTHRDHTQHKMPEKGCLSLSLEITAEAEEKTGQEEIPDWLKESKEPSK